MQDTYQFIGEDATFNLKNAENYSYLYFPVAGEAGIKSAVTPNLSGDCKIDQNTFILEPVSAENLHNNRSSRNFWCHVANAGNWSATGISAEEESKKFTGLSDKNEVTAGLMWHTVTRTSDKYQLSAEITSFVPVDENAEIMYVEITNIGKMQVRFTPTAAIPLYGRSADNIRDHRHVTSLLHRIKTGENGVLVTPTLSFDERGHRKNDVTYFVCGFDGNGEPPKDFYPVVEDYIGEGGNFERPEAVVKNLEGVKAGCSFAGCEAVGGLHFKEVVLEAGETVSYTVLIGALKQQEAAEEKTDYENTGSDTVTDWKNADVEHGIAELTAKYKTADKVKNEFARVKAYWEEKVNVSYHTGDLVFDKYMHWVSFQPILRRIYGCSFLPHHDYGKGGRGWRDLWQDCLALLIMNPDGVREMLLSNFAGVRMDGTNATIIGERQGEFIADRNNITRVWMDHGVWPFFTTKLYIDETGDIEILDEQAAYFKDRQVVRGTKKDDAWDEAYGCWQKTETQEIYKGSVLEHLLLQNLTAFYEVGEHGHILLRGADWNDALDMAPERGESVAFTNAYAGNLKDIAELLKTYQEKTGKSTVFLAKEISVLLGGDGKLYDSVEKKKELLLSYAESCVHNVSGEKTEVPVKELIESLSDKAEWMMDHIRNTEWVTDSEGNGWFNGYYDNHGRRVEGEFEQGIRMMLTSQVFAVMAGTAKEEQVKEIIKSADRYLYKEEVGGYRLNTDFDEVKMDLGRMFGFAYGEKENGAVFSHMAVMYANALYRRGFAAEGYKALSALYRQSVNFPVSRIYPGIPEYFNGRGRGMYHYLTGAASWYMLTVITEMFGVKGKCGDLLLMPKLMPEQFDKNGLAKLSLFFAGVNCQVIYENKEKKAFDIYQIEEVRFDGRKLDQEEWKADEAEKSAIIPRTKLEEAGKMLHEVYVVLK